ncbi:MAG: trigger factor [Patescibacteria group bacterium]|nr:trigger factor [Patescibacteria group bacterium]
MVEKRTVEINNVSTSEVEIKSSISVEELNRYKEGALKKLGEEISMDGFRKGHIPENILKEKLGELAILNQMAEMALADIYPLIVVENKIDVIGHPQVTITKLAPDNPVEFTVKSAIFPQFELPDYKKIAKKINSEKQEVIEVKDEEMETAIKQIQKVNQSPEAIKEETREGNVELTDEFVKKLGDFKDVDDFKNKLKENIKLEKTNKAGEAKKVKIMDKILTETKLELPEIIIKDETERLLNQTKADITRMGLQFDKYLEHLKKTEEDLRKELQPDAEKRAKIQFILDKITKTEKIEVDKGEVEKNIKEILKQHKEAKEENVRPYIEMVLSNQEVFKLLEEQK